MSAKDLLVRPISANAANAIVRRLHYSHRVTRNSQLHLGVFMDGKIEGALQFGPPMDRRKTLPLVRDTPWNNMMELNRLAFSERLPRNSESRALAIAFRIMRKQYPHLEWIVSFADGTQCGDGTIYRAAGFVLTSIKRNTTLWRGPQGDVIAALSVQTTGATLNKLTMTKGKHISRSRGSTSMQPWRDAGYEPIPGFQLRYLYFLNPAARARLTVPILPFSKIDEMGAGMYKGARRATVDDGHTNGAVAVQLRPARSETTHGQTST
jgi:hypothetical protein